MHEDEYVGPGSGFVGAPPVVGTHVRLRPLDTADYGALYWMEQDPSIAPRFRHRPTTVRPELYGDAVWDDVVCLFAVDSNDDGSLIGMVSVFNADSANGHARMATVVRPDLLDESWPLEMIELMLDHVFTVFAFRKIYTEVMAPTLDYYERSYVAFDVEGRLRDHVWCEGSWEDLVVLAVHRSAWLERT